MISEINLALSWRVPALSVRATPFTAARKIGARMKKSLSVAAALGAATALLALAPAGAATQARLSHSAAQSGAAVSTHAARQGHKPKTGPALSYFYVYGGTGYGDLCVRLVAASGGAGTGNSFNLSDYGCRNADESIDNASPTAVRLYYSPNDGGAWTCIPANKEFSNLNQSDYLFNSAPTSSTPGYKSQVWLNVASVQASTSNNCSNAIGNPPQLTG
jgi:hypothetical protein